MFNLEHAINEWREQMVAGGIRTPEILEELESHLRDDIEQEVRLGVDAQVAFLTATKRIGESHALTKEFRKAKATLTPLQLFGWCGFALCAWLAYICLTRMCGYANQAYSLWLSDGSAQQVETAAQYNILWGNAATASAILSIACLSAGFRLKGKAVFRLRLGAIFIILSVVMAAVGWWSVLRLAHLGPPSFMVTWSIGGMTFQGEQIYIAFLLCGLSSLLMLVTGLYFFLSNQRQRQSGESLPRISANV